MAKKGRRFTFHGAYKSKKKAVTKERKVHGFIRKRRMRGGVRYLVMTRNK